jgi:hypothetical protein
MYIYNDFAGKGLMELMENLVSIDGEFDYFRLQLIDHGSCLHLTLH